MSDRSPSPEPAPGASARKTRWLSRGLESLVLEHLRDAGSEPRFHFDAIVVGSGYGGAIAALEATRWNPVVRPTPDAAASAAVPIRVCVLERGSEYLQGMFPEQFSELGGAVRFSTPDAAMPRGQLDGLFDLRLGADVNALVANGLGGGSLINAGVMKMPHPSVFAEPGWPAPIRRHRRLERLSRDLQRMLGAKPIARETAKVDALRRVAPARFSLAPITVADADGANDAGTLLDRCIDCGNCATGCNHNAKDSLDLNLLRSAHARGAEVFSGATVLRVEKAEAGDGWTVHVVHTERHLRERQDAPFRLRARTVILAAGTFGSTEILQRSRSSALALSDQLGRKFSANGDIVAVVRNLAPGTNAVADEAVAPERREVGPTISGVIDLRTGDPQNDLVIEDLGIPAPLRRLFTEVTTCAGALDALLDAGGRQAPDEDEPDPAAVDPELARDSLVVAMMVRDPADGRLSRLPDGEGSPEVPGTTKPASAHPRSDGLSTVRWPGLRDDGRLAMAHDRLDALLKAAGSGSSPEAPARLVPSPLWKPLSNRLEHVFGEQRGGLLSVHPLGGCAMGDDARSGVVDQLGRVFDPGPLGGVHAGLHVLDGSIVPTSLGINPSLAIATLARRGARRAAAELRRRMGDRSASPPARPAPLAAVRRPNFAIRPHTVPEPTRIELTEQLCGTVRLAGAPMAHPGYHVELTLSYEPKRVDALHSRRWQDRQLVVAEGKGSLRIFERTTGADDETREHDIATARVRGSLRVLRRESSGEWWRRVRGTSAWLPNRGLRDIFQSAEAGVRRWLRMDVAPPGTGGIGAALGYLRDIWQLCGHAGAVRLMEYELEVFEPRSGSHGGSVDRFTGPIRGIKRLTYGPGSNPWRQLATVALQRFPGQESTLRRRWAALWRDDRERAARPTLTLNLRHLADKGVPLLRVVEQADRPAALGELMSFALYVARVVVDVHALSFRKPDPAPVREAQRLPVAIDRQRARDGFDLHIEPEIDWVVMPGFTPEAPAERIRLARYRASPNTTGRPVLLVHGYSASGTTFVHRSVEGNLTETLAQGGRDVWILDMRSSCGLPSARDGWSFETLGHEDIRAAIDRVLATTGAPRIDLVAHCMGSVSLNMLLLGEPEHPSAPHRRIGRVVMSQVGPVLRMSTANVFRAYVMRWIKTFLPVADYSFRPAGDALGGQLLDRILATTSYPPSEFRRENPLWPPGRATGWLSLRHRMDALYARAFKLANMSEAVLDDIDDFFGPLSVETVSQVIHFARLGTIADRTGRNLFVSPFRLQSRMAFPVLYIHGEENGIVDAASLGSMRAAWRRAAIEHEPLTGWPDPHASASPFKGNLEQRGKLFTWCIPAHGHQDPMIGRDAARVSAVLARFLAG